MTPGLPPSLEGDYAHCGALASTHYENFPVASRLLPASLRPHVAALYAFARTADDFADEPIHEGKRLVELDRWERDLGAALKGRPANPVARAFAHTLRAFRIPPEVPLRLLTAFRMDVRQGRWKDWDALMHYGRHSADPVGRCVLYLAGVREEKWHRLSDRVCTGLQLINFWQDVSVDLARGRIYLPKAEWRAHKVRETDLLAGKDTDRTRALVRACAERSEEVFRSGFPLARGVPPFLRRELQATFEGGLAILRALRRMGYGVFARRPTLTAWDKMRMAFAAFRG
jgi:squalene synthase HpnC